MKIDKNIKTPLYIQVYKNIKKAIENSELLEGEKLPSIRSLANKLDVNNITIVNGYKLLEEEGYVYSLKGSGTYVRPSRESIELDLMANGNLNLLAGGTLDLKKDRLDLASVEPSPDLFPVDLFKETMNEVLERDRGLAFTYPEIGGYKPLKSSISDFLENSYSISIDENLIQIISGGQQGIDTIAKSILSFGDTVIVENPTYLGALAAFKSRGVKVIGVEMEEDGINTDLLTSYIVKYNPKALYLMPSYQNPTSYSYSEEKKMKILSLSLEHDFYIIEDDFLMDMSFDEEKRPLKYYDKDNETVIYIKSFSKSFMPGLRIGFMTMPQDLITNIIRAKHSTDISSSGFLQRSFDLYLRKGYWKSYIQEIRAIYRENYQSLVRGLKRLKRYSISYSEPNGGLSLWLRLPENIRSLDLVKKCEQNGLSIMAGDIFFVDNSIYSNYVRLSFSNCGPQDLMKAVDLLEASIVSLL